MAPDHDPSNRELFDEFIAESRMELARVEPLVNGLLLGPAPSGESLAAIFRCLHAFKGTASFYGLEVFSRLAHSAESLIDLFRSGARPDREHTDALHAALDALREVLDAVTLADSEESATELCRPIAQRLDHLAFAIVRGRGETRAQSASERVVPADAEPPPRSEDMGYALPPELIAKFVAESEEHLALVEEVLVAIEAGASTPAQVSEAFRAMHSLKGNCGICGCSQMEEVTHHAETLLERERTEGGVLDERRVSLLLEVLDALRVALVGVPAGTDKVPNFGYLVARLGEACGNPQTAAHPAPRLVAEPRLSSVPAEFPFARESSNDVVVTSSSRGTVDVTRGASRGAASIRVEAQKLDDLMNLVGELIIAETSVTKNPDLEGYEFENFQKAALNLNRLTRALQDIAMAVRMVPIANTFKKMTRLVRDVSSKQSKRVELVTRGEDTEVDKTVVEMIADPLVHLIRNAVDHGIEPSAERVKSGKPAAGRVALSARHQGGEVWITVRDDGRGLDPHKILKKALEKKLADPARHYTEREIIDMIYAPGFSTAGVVTDISGRGVGLDVVRRNIEGINGRIETSSELGVGTTFTFRLPLTLAIIEGMLVKVGGSYYTIPLLSIRESVRAKRKDITVTSDGCELLKLRRRHYPIVRIHQLHSVCGARELVEEGILVIVEAGDRLACLLVDEVKGQSQTVIKALPEYLRRVRGLSGCSILHNGDISLILDVESVVEAAINRAA